METLMKYITRTSRCTNLYMSKELEPEGLSGYQRSYILEVCRNPGISQEQLAQKIFINKSNVTRQLAVLEQNGFVTRSPCGTDRRIMQVYPTGKALDLYPKVKKLLAEWNEYLSEDFTGEECLLLGAMMERVMNKAVMRIEKRSDKEEN